MPIDQFHDRRQAGELLARKLAAYAHRRDVVVIALARGGVPVGFAIAERLQVEFDVLQVRKLGIPGNEGLAMGAVTDGGVCVLRPEIVNSLDIPPEVIEAAAQRELRDMQRRLRAYRSSKPEPRIQDRTVILVDDGLETGATMQAAVRALQHRRPAQVIVALPVAAPQNLDELKPEADDVICLDAPAGFVAVRHHYVDYADVADADIRKCLAEAEQWHVPDRVAAEGRIPPQSHPTVPG
jgi:predicted phosphoribosyltransferase